MISVVMMFAGRSTSTDYEDLLNKTTALTVVLAVAMLPGWSGCHKTEEPVNSDSAATQTIPASELPSAQSPTGSDAMTQTVSVEDGRSEDEGGTITTKSGAPSTTAAAPGPVTATTTAAARKSKKRT